MSTHAQMESPPEPRIFWTLTQEEHDAKMFAQTHLLEDLLENGGSDFDITLACVQIEALLENSLITDEEVA